MSGTHSTVMGDRGRLVIPAELRERMGFSEGTPVVLLETPSGVVMLSREQLKTQVRRDMAGANLITELLTERRDAARREDAATPIAAT